MFTGIVETTTPILEKTDEGLVLARPDTFSDLKMGSSICVSGACLSVVGMDEQMMAFDVVPETWKKTKLGSLSEKDHVNLERSMRGDDRFEGHIVQGHVEGVGEVIANGEMGGEWLLHIQVPKELLPMVIPKGSIAIDGVSLTVADIEGGICTIALIPHTLSVTTLGSLKQGHLVNLETDMFLRGLERMMMMRLGQ